MIAISIHLFLTAQAQLKLIRDWLDVKLIQDWLNLSPPSLQISSVQFTQSGSSTPAAEGCCPNEKFFQSFLKCVNPYSEFDIACVDPYSEFDNEIVGFSFKNFI